MTAIHDVALSGLTVQQAAERLAAGGPHQTGGSRCLPAARLSRENSAVLQIGSRRPKRAAELDACWPDFSLTVTRQSVGSRKSSPTARTGHTSLRTSSNVGRSVRTFLARRRAVARRWARWLAAGQLATISPWSWSGAGRRKRMVWMPDVGFSAEMVSGMPVVVAPEQIDITKAADMPAVLPEAAAPANPAAEAPRW